MSSSCCTTFGNKCNIKTHVERKKEINVTFYASKLIFKFIREHY